MKKQFTLGQINTVIDAMEVMEKVLGGNGEKHLSSLAFFLSDEQKKILSNGLTMRNNFYKMPLEERLIKSGYKKDKEGNLSKTIIL